MDLVEHLKWVEWSTYNHFFCNINETIIRQTTDALVATGLLEGLSFSLYAVWFVLLANNI